MSSVLKDMNIIMDSHSLALDLMKKTETQVDLRPAESREVPKDQEVLLQARLKAHKIMEKAAEQAQKILMETLGKAREEAEEAKKAGFDEGYIQGKRKAEAEVRFAVARLEALDAAIEARKQAVLQEYEAGLRDVAFTLAQKILDTRLEAEDAAFLPLFEKAVRQCGPQEWIELTVSEFEAAFATTNAPLLLSLAKEVKDIKIKVLPKAPRGTCIVETPVSVVDASVATQLSRLEESLAQFL